MIALKRRSIHKADNVCSDIRNASEIFTTSLLLPNSKCRRANKYTQSRDNISFKRRRFITFYIMCIHPFLAVTGVSVIGDVCIVVCICTKSRICKCTITDANHFTTTTCGNHAIYLYSDIIQSIGVICLCPFDFKLGSQLGCMIALV